jgi:hypothetical protein
MATVTIGRPLGRHAHVRHVEYADDGASHTVAAIGKFPKADTGNDIKREIAFYKGLAEFDLIDDARVLRYIGSGTLTTPDGTTVEVLVVERAVGSLDLVRAGDEGASRELREELATRFAQAALAMLTTMRRLQEDPSISFDSLAHRDIKTANAFLVERGMGFDVVIGDFGFVRIVSSDTFNVPTSTAAPEQIPPQRTPAGFATDLWGVGLALWSLLNGGRVPYLAPGRNPREHVAEDNADLTTQRVDHEAILAARGSEILALRFAAHLLDSEPRRREAAAEEYRQLIVEECARLDACFVSAGAADHHRRVIAQHFTTKPGREWPVPDAAEPAPLTPSARALAEQAPAAVAREPREKRAAPTWPRELRLAVGRTTVAVAALVGHTALLLLAVVLLAAGVAAATTAIALGAGWWQVMPLADSGADSVVRVVAAAAFLAASVVMGVFQTIRRRATPVDKKVRVTFAGPILAATLTAVGLVAVVTLGLGLPLDPLSLVVVAAAAVTAAFIDNGLQALGRRTKKTRWRLAPRLVLAAVAFVVGASVVSTTVFLPGNAAALADHAVAPQESGSVSGMPGGVPVLLNPHTMAVNSRGDVAVVDRVGVYQDVIWVIPDSGVPYRVLNSVNWAAPTESILARPPEATSDNLVQEVLALRPTGTGDTVHDIESIDFLDDDSLVLLGTDGVTRLDFSPPSGSDIPASAGGVRTERITDGVSPTGAGGRTSQVFADGSRLYFNRVAVKGEVADQDYCSFPGVVRPALWSLDLDGDEVVPEPVFSAIGRTGDQASSVEDPTRLCIDDVQILYRADGGLRMVSEQVIGDHRAYVSSRTDGIDAFELGAIDGPELETIDPDRGIRAAAGDSARLLINSGYCVSAVALIEGTAIPAMTGPAPVDESTGGNRWCERLAPGQVAHDDPDCAGAGVNWIAGLQTDENLWSPMASGGPDGDAYVIGAPIPGCTPVVYRLQSDGQLAPMAGIRSQASSLKDYELGETALMSASSPRISGEWASISAPALGRMWTSPLGTTSYRSEGFSTFISSPIVSGLTIAGEPDVRVEMGSEVDPEGASTTQLFLFVIAADERKGDVRYEVRVPLPGMTDIQIAGPLVIARCGQILALDRVAVTALVGDLIAKVAAGELEPQGGTVEHTYDPSVLAGGATLLVGRGDITTPCAPLVSTPSAATSSLTATDIAPLAIDVHENGDAGYLIAFTDAAMFGDVAMSRVRVADTGAGWLRTVGFDPAQRAHIVESYNPTGRVFVGDLTRFGLVATDVAMNDGVVAVSTVGQDEPGPLLLLSGNEARVVDIGADRQATGVAWLDDDLIVSDGTFGDLIQLDVSTMTDSADPPIVGFVAGLFSAPPGGSD